MEQLATDQFDPCQVVPRQIFTPFSRPLISTAFVVVSGVGCIRVTGENGREIKFSYCITNPVFRLLMTKRGMKLGNKARKYFLVRVIKCSKIRLQIYINQRGETSTVIAGPHILTLED